MAAKQIQYTDIDDALGRIERINNGIAFLGELLPYYPHAEGWQEIATILQCLSERADESIKKIETLA